MAFAIFYNAQDLAAMAGAMQAGTVTGADRNEANRIWGGGLSTWATAPLGMSPCDIENGIVNDGTVVRVVINVSNYTLADFRAFLHRLSTKYGENYTFLRGLANDMEGCSGAWEPWPPV